MRLVVVDYGLGNLGSVNKAFRRFGAAPELSADPARLLAADAVVLPGDGAFGATMAEIRSRGLEAPLRRCVEAGVPLLGICVGMQVLFEESEEHGRHAGFGFLRGRVRRFEGPLAVPHMGWNRLHKRRAHPACDVLREGEHVYFVHSYYAAAEPHDLVATSDYGREFAAVVGRDRILGMQFHPEKSQGVGLRLVEGFLGWVASLRGSLARGLR